MTAAPGYATGLGKLCMRKHDDGGGYSLRYHVNGQPIGNCVTCGREANRNAKRDQRKRRKRLSTTQGVGGGKYKGPLCKNKHGIRQSLRYVTDGSCIQCDKDRREARRRPDPDNKRRANIKRVLRGLDSDLAIERTQTFDNESRRRELQRKAKGT